MILPSPISQYRSSRLEVSDGLSSSSDVHTHVLERRQELRLDNHCLSSVLFYPLGHDPPLSCADWLSQTWCSSQLNVSASSYQPPPPRPETAHSAQHSLHITTITIITIITNFYMDNSTVYLVIGSVVYHRPQDWWDVEVTVSSQQADIDPRRTHQGSASWQRLLPSPASPLPLPPSLAPKVHISAHTTRTDRPGTLDQDNATMFYMAFYILIRTITINNIEQIKHDWQIRRVTVFRVCFQWLFSFSNTACSEKPQGKNTHWILKIIDLKWTERNKKVGYISYLFIQVIGLIYLIKTIPNWTFFLLLTLYPSLSPGPWVEKLSFLRLGVGRGVGG